MDVEFHLMVDKTFFVLLVRCCSR